MLVSAVASAVQTLAAVLFILSLTTATFASGLSAASSDGISAAPIVISGAGPASLVFAHRYLRLRNDDDSSSSCKIVVFEKRSRPKRYVDTNPTECVAGDQAFGFGLSKKAQSVLSKIPGLLPALEAISQPTTFAPGIDLRIINRRELCAELLYELEQEFGKSGRFQIEFDAAVTRVDEDSVVTVTHTRGDDDESQKKVPYSLLIAADGANSQVRNDLIGSGDLSCERYLSDVTWKALQLPQQPRSSSMMDASSFSRYRTKRDNGAIIPRFENRFVLLNFRAVGGKDCDPQYPLDAKTPEALRTAISALVPQLKEFPDDVTLQKFIDQRPGREAYMKLNRHAVPEKRIALLGDASVGMYSLFGQGAASAMWQADLLATTLAAATDGPQDDTAHDSLEAALQSYSDVSIVEGHAITDLNLLTHALRQRGLIKLWAAFQMMGIGKTLSQQPQAPYSDILKKWKRAIWFSKFFWRRVRVQVNNPSSSKNSDSTNAEK